MVAHWPSLLYPTLYINLFAGEVFNVPKSNKRHRTLFCRLSSNHKTLHYGYDIANNDNPCPSIDELPEKRKFFCFYFICYDIVALNVLFGCCTCLIFGVPQVDFFWLVGLNVLFITSTKFCFSKRP